MSVIASQLVGTVNIQNVDASQAQLVALGAATDAAQTVLDTLATQALTTGASFSVITAATDELTLGFASTSDAAAYVKDQLALYASTSADAAVTAMDMSGATDVASSSLSAAAIEANKVAISQERLNVAMLQSDTAMARFASTQARAAVSAEALSKAQIQTQLAQLKLTAATEAASTEEGIWSGVTAAMGVVAEGAATGIGVIVDALFTLVAVAATVVVAITAVTLAIGAFASKAAADFQQQMTKLYTTAGEAKNNLTMVGAGILDMTSQVGTGAKTLGDAMYWIESGGLHAKKALEALKIAAEGAKAEGANLNDVSIALAASLNAYAGYGLKDATVMNILVAATGQGMLTMQQLAVSLANVLPASARFGVSLTDVTAALATMTAQGDRAEQAATHLRQVILALEAPSKIGAAALKSVGLTTQEVADEMRKSLPDALQMITDAVGKKFPEGSAAYNQAIKNIAGGSKQLMGFLELTGSHLATFDANVRTVTDHVKQGGNAVLGWADIQQNFNFKIDAAKAALDALWIKIGTAFLPIMGSIVEKVTPVIVAFGQWVAASSGLTGILQTISGVLGQVGAGFNAVFNPIAKLAPIVKPLADSFDRATSVIKNTYQAAKPLTDAFDRASAVIKKTYQAVLPMSDSFDRATSVIRGTSSATQGAINPWTQFFTVVKKVADFIAHVDWASVWKTVTTDVNNVKTAIQAVWDALSKVDWAGIWNTLTTAVKTAYTTFVELRGAFETIGAFLSTTFAPDVVQLQHSWQDLSRAIQPLMPEIEQMGMALGGLLVIVMAVSIGLLDGLARAIAGVMQIITGVIQFFSGFVQTMDALSQLLADVFTMNFGNLGKDIDAVMWGLVNMFTGVFNIIAGLWNAVYGAIDGMTSGFITTIEAAFQGLSDVLVGHSIIPDMVNGIISWFQNMADIVPNIVNDMSSMVTSIFSTLYNVVVGHSIVKDLNNDVVTQFHSMSAGAVSATNMMSANVSAGFDTMQNNAVNAVQTMSSDARANFARLNGDLASQMSSIDATVVGYWNSIADYIASHQITGTVNWVSSGGPVTPGGPVGAPTSHFAEGTSFAPGGESLVGEAGAELVLGPRVGYLPRGAQVIPHNQLGSMGGSSSSGSGGGRPIILELNGRQVARALLPDIVTEVRNHVGVRM